MKCLIYCVFFLYFHILLYTVLLKKNNVQFLNCTVSTLQTHLCPNQNLSQFFTIYPLQSLTFNKND